MKLISLFVLVLLVSSMAMASQSFLGTSGTILTPDDTVLPAAAVSASYNIINLDGADPSYLGAAFGVNGSLEIGIARIEPDIDGVDAETILNAKYLAMPETATRPSLAFGVVDLAGSLDDDGSFYGVIGKNLTSFATDVTGRPSIPLHGYVGYGTGMYDGLFAGLSWALSPKLKIMGEFVAEDSIFNAGAAFQFSDAVTGQFAILDGDDFGFGISYGKNL